MAGKLRTIKPLATRFDGRVVKPEPKRADAELLTPEHKEFRRIVCSRAGWRCEWIEGGIRCNKRAPFDRMVADHIVERADGGALFDPANGACLCIAHNTLKGSRARRDRALG